MYTFSRNAFWHRVASRRVAAMLGTSSNRNQQTQAFDKLSINENGGSGRDKYAKQYVLDALSEVRVYVRQFSH